MLIPSIAEEVTPLTPTPMRQILPRGLSQKLDKLNGSAPIIWITESCGHNFCCLCCVVVFERHIAGISPIL